MKKRIWELDALRGLCILGVVAVHFVYDLVELFGLVRWEYPLWFSLIKNWGGTVFLLLSGVCVTLGSRCVRRGGIVLGCGMLCTAVTFAMSRMGYDSSIIIYFGVLHCLGLCMLLWPLVKKLPTWALGLLGLLAVALGFYFQTLTVQSRWLFPLGLCHSGFASSDYFPLLPYWGFFLLGAVLGRTAYRNRTSLFPKISGKHPLLRPLSFCGRHSLLIYLLHQPVLYGSCYLISVIWRQSL